MGIRLKLYSQENLSSAIPTNGTAYFAELLTLQILQIANCEADSDGIVSGNNTKSQCSQCSAYREPLKSV